MIDNRNDLETKDQINKILNKGIELGKVTRLNLTELKTYIIDDNNTTEIDDCISLEKDGEKEYIWVHISDPSHFIIRDSSLDKELVRKGTSIYLANETITMLPKKLIKHIFNFSPNKASYALSLKASINEDGSVQNMHFYKTIVKPTYRLNYEEIDELIELKLSQEFSLNTIFNAMLRRHEYRNNRGAISLNDNYGKIFADVKKPMLRIYEFTKSRLMVSESMILFNYCLSLFCISNKIPIPFRSQNLCELPKEVLRETNRIIKNYRIKKYFNQSYISTTPSQHSSLGLKSYTQATSPIRRALDLIIHRQVKSFLDGKLEYTKIEIDTIINIINPKIKEVNQIQIADQEKWRNIYFEFNRNTKWNVVFLRWLNFHKYLALVHFVELSMDIAIFIEHSRKTEIGDCFQIRLLTNASQGPSEFTPI